MTQTEPERRGGSLALRLFLLTSCFAVLAIVVIALVLGQVYRASMERRFQEVLTAHLYNLMGSVDRNAEGRLSGLPDLGDPRFLRFQSGWYWSVTADADAADTVTSRSLAGETMPPAANKALDERFQREYRYIDTAGQDVSVLEAQVLLGEGDNLYVFKVAANRDEIQAETRRFLRNMVLALALFAIGFVIASYGIVVIGLRPIAGAIKSLADIRDGKANRIEGSYPREIQPLIDETNQLIETNRRVVERARTQVGNLAHSLKTPIAVILNEARSAGRKTGPVLLEQARLMQLQVDNYLDRARIAAIHGTLTARCETAPVLERLVRVIARLNPDISIIAELDPGIVFAGEQQDLEEIAGNLLENAAKFAKKTIRLQTRLGGPAQFTLTIADDGPGMTDSQAEEALKRGIRLDESKPGSGLGLSIVKDIASEYGGSLVLDRSKLGGLAVEVTLPAR